jgi:hypothetical protein
MDTDQMIKAVTNRYIREEIRIFCLNTNIKAYPALRPPSQKIGQVRLGGTRSRKRPTGVEDDDDDDDEVYLLQSHKHSVSYTICI